MIAPHCFQPEWIRSRRDVLGGGDPILIEKAIHAFALLDHLAQTDLPFVFKGGTSLLLRLERLRRLSIDIDILCPAPSEEVDEALRQLSHQAPFQRIEEDDRGADRLPRRRHFKLHYTSSIDLRQQAAYVLLDVVQEEAPHPVIEALSLRSPFVELTEESRVRVPTAASLLGDKLTAFAPNTVGVPCRDSSAMQVVKQLFDVSELFQMVGTLDEVGQAYQRVFEKENEYRGARFTQVQALQDALDSARGFGRLRLRGAGSPTPQTQLLDSGGRQLASHLLGLPFNDSQRQLACARVACLAACVLSGQTAVRRFSQEEVPTLCGITLQDSVLNRLNGINPEAFHYWHVVEELLS